LMLSEFRAMTIGIHQRRYFYHSRNLDLSA
jgi:hypothetical protein